jgi:hypothetical protein
VNNYFRSACLFRRADYASDIGLRDLSGTAAHHGVPEILEQLTRTAVSIAAQSRRRPDADIEPSGKASAAATGSLNGSP